MNCQSYNDSCDCGCEYTRDYCEFFNAFSAYEYNDEYELLCHLRKCLKEIREYEAYNKDCGYEYKIHRDPDDDTASWVDSDSDSDASIRMDSDIEHMPATESGIEDDEDNNL